MVTGEVVWNVDAWLHGDDHPGREDSVPVDGERVVSVHPEEVADVVRIETIHRLQDKEDTKVSNLLRTRIIVTLQEGISELFEG